VSVNCTDLSLFPSLLSRLHARYSNSPPEVNVMWMLGSAVAAYHIPHNVFYRAQIVGFEDDRIQV